jgi:uncharacterized Fe-S center protein
VSRVLFAPPDDIAGAIPKLIEASGFLERLSPRKRLGIKLHFGEDGNWNYLKPAYVRVAVETVSRRVTECALLETCTLYRGNRATAEAHIALAHKHGFTVQAVLAPVEIIDGAQGNDYHEVPVNLPLVKRARLGRKLKHFHSLLNLAHFKGHFVTGFGGVIKNLAMGLAAKGGKLEMHSQYKPAVDEEKCTSCGRCVEYCPHQAIDFIHEVARIGRSCIGCGGCIMVCKQSAIGIKWDEAAANVSRKVVEYAYAVLHGANGTEPRLCLNLNFAINITPNCDCMGTTEEPVMPDVGVFASFDPVACEQAAFDRTRAALKKLYPHLDPQQTIDYAEEIGLGSRRYELETV